MLVYSSRRLSPLRAFVAASLRRIAVTLSETCEARVLACCPNWQRLEHFKERLIDALSEFRISANGSEPLSLQCQIAKA